MILTKKNHTIPTIKSFVLNDLSKKTFTTYLKKTIPEIINVNIYPKKNDTFNYHIVIILQIQNYQLCYEISNGYNPINFWDDDIEKTNIRYIEMYQKLLNNLIFNDFTDTNWRYEINKDFIKHQFLNRLCFQHNKEFNFDDKLIEKILLNEFPSNDSELTIITKFASLDFNDLYNSYEKNYYKINNNPLNQQLNI